MQAGRNAPPARHAWLKIAADCTPRVGGHSPAAHKVAGTGAPRAATQRQTAATLPRWAASGGPTDGKVYLPAARLPARRSADGDAPSRGRRGAISAAATRPPASDGRAAGHCPLRFFRLYSL